MSDKLTLQEKLKRIDKLIDNVLVERYLTGKIKKVYGIRRVEVAEKGFSTGRWATDKMGPYEEYYRNGQRKFKCTYFYDTKEGPYEEYYDNGAIKEKGTYEDDKKYGPCVEYDKQGRPTEKSRYQWGKKNGPCEKYTYGPNNEKSVTKGYYNWGVLLDYKKAAKKRSKLNKELNQIAKQTKGSTLTKILQRKKVAAFRKEYPETSAGRAPRKPKTNDR